VQTYGLADKSVRPTRALVLTFHEKAGCTKNGAPFFFSISWNHRVAGPGFSRSSGISGLRPKLQVNRIKNLAKSSQNSRKILMSTNLKTKILITKLLANS